MAFGDRRDGKRVRDIHGFQNILIDFKPNRCDSVVYMNVDIDMTNFVKYMRDLKKEHKDLTFFHGLVQLMGKTVYSRPYLNRFIANSTMYEHNKVQLASTIKEEFSDGSVEALMVIDVEPDDTLLDISKKTHEKVDRIRHKQSSDIDGTADMVGKLPLYLRKIVTGVLKWLDKHGWLPRSLMDDNIYYSTAILSNLGTFKTNGIYHNLTNFGTSSMLITFGEIKEVSKGKWMMNFGATLDERIADGFYFCKALKLIEYMCANPEILMEKASKKVSIDKKD